MKGEALDSLRRGKVAWDLTMEVFSKFWRDISVVRSPSSGVEDGDQVTIFYLWAVVQAHRVMDNYERHLFDNHLPSLPS